MSAIEERIDADLALGRHQELIGELEALIRATPAPRAASRPAHARPVPLGPSGRGSRCLPGRPPNAATRSSGSSRASPSSDSSGRSSSTTPTLDARRGARPPRPSRRPPCCGRAGGCFILVAALVAVATAATLVGARIRARRCEHVDHGAAGNSVAVFDSSSTSSSRTSRSARHRPAWSWARAPTGSPMPTTTASRGSTLSTQGRGRHDRRGQRPERHHDRRGRGLGDQQPGRHGLADRSRRRTPRCRRATSATSRLGIAFAARLDLGRERSRRDDHQNRRG